MSKRHPQAIPPRKPADRPFSRTERATIERVAATLEDVDLDEAWPPHDRAATDQAEPDEDWPPREVDEHPFVLHTEADERGFNPQAFTSCPCGWRSAIFYGVTAERRAREAAQEHAADGGQP